MPDLVRKNATLTATGEIPAGAYNFTTSAWTLGSSNGLGTAAAAYHTQYGSIVAKLSSVSTAGLAAGPAQYRLGANYYLDQVGAAKAITTGGMAFHNIAASTNSGDDVFTWHTNTTSQSADISISGTTTKIGVATAGGAWTLGSASFDVVHQILGSQLNITRTGNIANASTVLVQTGDASGTLGILGGYRNASNGSASGFIMCRGTLGTTFYMYVAVNTGTWYMSSSSTDIGLAAGTVVGSQTSDIRLKWDIEPLKYGLKEICQMNPISFILNNQKQIGFSAQQVRSILPEVVYDTGEKIDGYDETKLAMHYSHITAALVNAVKELKAELDAYKASHP